MKVTLFQYRLFHYRVRLFDLMRERCRERGIELVLVHGQPFRDEAKKRDCGELDWAVRVNNRYFPIVEKKDLCWQPAPREARDSDLVIVMQENRLLANYVWILRRAFGLGPRVAFWGHGRDFQSLATRGVRAGWKQFVSTRVDWWFAYTELSRRCVLNYGFPPDRITVLNNAIDNQSFENEMECVTGQDLHDLRQELGFSPRHFVGLFCGSMYPDKRLDVLFDACQRVHDRFTDFRLVLIGDGVDRPLVEAQCARHSWIRYLGVQYGARKAALYRLAQLTLCPGLVGLNILDAFLSGVPLITLSDSLHSPEIAYLEPGVNGHSVVGGAGAYADCVLDLIRDDRARARLSEGALAAAQRYTLENMALRFVDGIEACLKIPVRSASGARL